MTAAAREPRRPEDGAASPAGASGARETDYARWLPDVLRESGTGDAPTSSWTAVDGLPGTRLHVERHGPTTAAHRLVVLHGAGGHAGMLRPYAAALARHGTTVVVPDLPGYGRTRSADPGGVRYADWVTAASAILRAERATHEGRLTVVGASLGGLLAYEAAALTGAADVVVATSLLDPSDPASLRAIAPAPWLAPLVPTLVRGVVGGVADLRVPVRWLTRMGAISNVPGLTRAVRRDPLGGGGRVPLGFLRSYLEHRITVTADAAPRLRVVLAHPGCDRWTPVALSLACAERLPHPVELEMLPGAGHLPAEQPGVDRLLALALGAG